MLETVRLKGKMTLKPTIPWDMAAKLVRGPDRDPFANDPRQRMLTGGTQRGPVSKLVGVVARMPWNKQPLYAMILADGRCIYGPEISALAERDDYPMHDTAEPGDEDMTAIPWEAQAHFTDIDGDRSFTGTLTECVQAYGKLPAERRRGALITADELIEVPGQPTPSSNLDHEALDWLSDQLAKKGC